VQSKGSNNRKAQIRIQTVIDSKLFDFGYQIMILFVGITLSRDTKKVLAGIKMCMNTAVYIMRGHKGKPNVRN
jgi:hypothetical protein